MKTSLCFLLLGLLVGVSLCEDAAQSAPSAANSNFGIAVSNEVISYMLNLILPPVVQGGLTVLGTELPQSCCYGAKGHERLYLENMAIPPTSISTIVSVSDGPKVEIDLDFDVTLFYKLCNPSGLTCNVLFPCKGDATLGMKTKTKFDLVLAAGNNGGPDVSFEHFDFHLDMKKKGICFLLEGLLDSIMPFINVFLNLFLPQVLGPVIHDISLPHNFTIPGPLPLNLDWNLTQGTGSTKDGLSLQGVLDILLKSTGYQPAPFTPNHPLPLAVDNIQEGSSTFEITDSLLNNLLYTAYHRFGDFEFDTKQSGFKIKLSLSSAPIVNFTSAPGNQAALLSLYTHVSLTKLPLKIAVTSVDTAHFALLFNSEGQLYLSLDPNDFVVDITSMTPPQPNATKNKIEHEIESAWASFIPQINEALAAHPIALPHPKGAHSPSIDYFDGYARFLFETGENAEPAPFAIEEEPEVNSANVIDIPGGLQGSFGRSASPALLRMLEIVWESAHSLNPEEELLPFLQTGLPEGRALSCPNIPIFSGC